MSKELNYQKIQTNEKRSPLCELRYRPTTALFLTFAIGIFCLFAKQKFGVIFLAITVIGFYLFPNSLVMEIYDDGIIFYNPFNSEESLFVSNNDLQEWSVNEDQKIHVKTKDGSEFAQICPRSYKANELLSNYYPNQKAPSPLSKLHKN